MKLTQLHTTLFLSLCAALAACSDQDVLVDETQDGKTPILLSVGGVDAPATTRAIVTDGTTNTTFGRKTKIFFLMQSEKEVDGKGDVVTHDGYEYKGDRPNTLYNVARGDVTANTSAIVFDDNNKRYWDDAHARSSQLTMWAIAQQVAEEDVDGRWKNITFQNVGGPGNPSIAETSAAGYNTNTRIDWQGTTAVYPAIFSWSVGNLPSAHQNQNANTLIYQDLFFSNNIANYVGYTKVPEASRKDRRLKFDFSTRKFPRETDVWPETTIKKTEMKFYHAMSKITIQLKAGKGFKADGTDFKLKNNTVDLLHGFNTRGLFNIKDGEFQMIHDHADITSIPCTTTPNSAGDPYYTLEALAIPNIHQFMVSQRTTERPNLKDENSRFVSGNNNLETDVMMEITVDDNTFKITSDDLFKALNGKDHSTTLTDNDTYIPLEAGKNYIFTFTIGKQEIDNLTARVADWEDVVAEEQTPSNARITLNVENRTTNTTAVISNMDIYRALDEASSITDTYEGYNWTTKYTVDGKATWNSNPLAYNTDRWSTDWFWESNKTYYHFRTLSPTTQEVTQNASGDYTTITSSSCADDENYDAMSWGAPFLDVEDSYKFSYSTTQGFDGTGAEAATPTHQIYKAIGPTKEQIKVLMFHMFSGVHFTVKTTDGDDKVKLYDSTVANDKQRTKVELVGYYKDGKVLLGTGLVNTDGTISTEGSPYKVSCATTDTDHAYGNQDYYFSAVPQSLTNVVLVITTPDNNQYKVNLWDEEHPITASVTNKNMAIPYKESSVAGKYKINRWYPGFKYNYSFILRKKGIIDLYATVVDWETVTADDEEVQIK